MGNRFLKHTHLMHTRQRGQETVSLTVQPAQTGKQSLDALPAEDPDIAAGIPDAVPREYVA